MAIGLPAHHSRTYYSAVPDRERIQEAVIKAIGHMGWDLKKNKDGLFLATAGTNLWSWGEEIKIEILDNGWLQVVSKCAFPLQCLDWGQNKENVEKFLVELNKAVEGDAEEG